MSSTSCASGRIQASTLYGSTMPNSLLSSVKSYRLCSVTVRVSWAMSPLEPRSVTVSVSWVSRSLVKLPASLATGGLIMKYVISGVAVIF